MGDKALHLKRKHPSDTEHESLRRALSHTQREIECAYGRFNFTSDPDLIEASIYEISALQCRYNYLLRQAKAAEDGASLPQTF